MTYRTTEAYLSGGICGSLWMPNVVGGFPMRENLRARIDRFSDTRGATFRDVCLATLADRGGDFRDATFTADTRFVVIRRTRADRGQYTVHVWERDLIDVKNCADLVNVDVDTSDILGNDDDA